MVLTRAPEVNFAGGTPAGLYVLQDAAKLAKIAGVSVAPTAPHPQ